MVRNIISGRRGIKGLTLARGFTLVELLIVMSLMGILASIAIPTYNKSVTRAREATLRKDLYHMREAIDNFYGDHEIYPDSLEELVDKQYIRTIPVDPITGSKESWTEILSNDGSGIFDVVSGSEKAGRSGVAYSQW